jgi:hypothetical protein
MLIYVVVCLFLMIYAVLSFPFVVVMGASRDFCGVFLGACRKCRARTKAECSLVINSYG